MKASPECRLSNRRGFYRAAEELVAEAMRDGAPCFAAVMVDLDDFKRINACAEYGK
ncbi:diguanylate cyclase domain-containing protein [Mycolicibacterium hippocampi]|uniref:diguanylate cyclase domain-containing protein n=1 Tax=Mycolicibacterium hippocampi TaxID=659824 RepID=UPI0013D2B85D|nr:diguanylate cyclase [Mycolicibacterium hippocampi]